MRGGCLFTAVLDQSNIALIKISMNQADIISYDVTLATSEMPFWIFHHSWCSTYETHTNKVIRFVEQGVDAAEPVQGRPLTYFTKEYNPSLAKRLF